MPKKKYWETVGISFLGAGSVATALALSMQNNGYNITGISSKSGETAKNLASKIHTEYYKDPKDLIAQSDVTFVAVPDDVLQQLIQTYHWKDGHIIVHTSGAVAPSLNHSDSSLIIGNFHPLQTFIKGSTLPKGTSFAIEANDAEFIESLTELAQDLDGAAIKIPNELRPLYHLSAVLASNYLVTLLALSSQMWESFGYKSKEGLDALLPLVRQTIHNIDVHGVNNALTGPINRGDIGTISKHLETLRQKADSILPLYCEFAKHTVGVAKENGSISGETAEQIIILLETNQYQGGPSI
ncbi:MAG: Rossmann-like and DUF2520 domain-containing protein [Dehalococcoidia bacterium]